MAFSYDFNCFYLLADGFRDFQDNLFKKYKRFFYISHLLFFLPIWYLISFIAGNFLATKRDAIADNYF